MTCSPTSVPSHRSDQRAHRRPERPARATAAVAIALLAALAGPTAARAEPSQVSATGFISSFREDLSVPPEQAWKAIVALPRWWNGSHSYSGKAANFTLDAQAGGTWMERWTDAAGLAHSVQHGQVLMVLPPKVLRLSAALGPLQALAVNGVLSLETGSQEGKPFLRMHYRVAGAPDAGLEKLAPIVDRVMAEQFKRLKRLAETGQAE